VQKPIGGKKREPSVTHNEEVGIDEKQKGCDKPWRRPGAIARRRKIQGEQRGKLPASLEENREGKVDRVNLGGIRCRKGEKKKKKNIGRTRVGKAKGQAQNKNSLTDTESSLRFLKKTSPTSPFKTQGRSHFAKKKKKKKKEKKIKHRCIAPVTSEWRGKRPLKQTVGEKKGLIPPSNLINTPPKCRRKN